jgi:DNA-binding transcriptional MerR regulator
VSINVDEVVCMREERDEALLVSEAARRLGISPGWLRVLSDAGKVPCRRVLGLRVFDAAVIEMLARERAAVRAGR